MMNGNSTGHILRILDAWITEEVLSPQPIPTKEELQTLYRTMVRFNEYEEPWKEPRYRRARLEKSVFWMAYLGQMDLKNATEKMLTKFPDDYAGERVSVKGNTTLAVVVLDEQGRLASGSVFLSSFAWGYGKVLSNKLRELHSFNEAQSDIKKQIEERLQRQDKEGEILPVAFRDLAETIDWLARELNISREEVLPGFYARIPLLVSGKDAPQPELLNSFFIDDLTRVKKAFLSRNVGKALSLFLGHVKPLYHKDINEGIDVENSLLAQILSPTNLPLTRWPGKGKHPLYLMQQAAVNHVSSDLKMDGIVAVNGPPGTGKTTLLRDIIAKVVVDRAIAMSAFVNPANAYKHLAPIKIGNSYGHIYTLDASLIGHEIVVTSSNNKAVENISREIPSINSVDEEVLNEVRYFRTISDFLSSKTDDMEQNKTWGLAAAVLGNSSNRNAFINKLWWNPDYSLGNYLRAISDGSEKAREIKRIKFEREKRACTDDTPYIITAEEPPSDEIEALRRWETECKDFKNKLKRVRELRNIAADTYKACNEERGIRDSISVIEEEIKKEKNIGTSLEEDHKRLSILLGRKKSELNDAKENYTRILALKPGFLARLFNTKMFRDWYDRSLKAGEVIEKLDHESKEIESDRSRIDKKAQEAYQRLNLCMKRHQVLAQSLEKNRLCQRKGREVIGSDKIADIDFWSKGTVELQKSNPWLFSQLQQARDDLFCASFRLHKAFIDASAKQIKYNLSALFDVMKGRALSDALEPGLQSLWASLFIVVPVVSTTLASVSRMFDRVGRERLGWLLIDEAGQATPQSVVGALWRVQRAVVIGDPLQIEPVITIPSKLIKSIFSNYDLPHEEWSAPFASAQGLADQASWLGTTITAIDGDRWVGSPLRVHRRCEEPMFSIANRVAYDNLMVSATPTQESLIRNVLGKSCWFDVTDRSLAKWSQKEGDLVLQIMRKIIDAQISNPDIFIISPFRNVAFHLRELINRSTVLDHMDSVSKAEWTSSRIGTIHTFQGKEAEAVILVLGASGESESGARRWAGGTPNVLNVAVTRAKRCLYVVGDSSAWENAGSFKELKRSIEVRKA